MCRPQQVYVCARLSGTGAIAMDLDAVYSQLLLSAQSDPNNRCGSSASQLCAGCWINYQTYQAAYLALASQYSKTAQVMPHSPSPSPSRLLLRLPSRSASELYASQVTTTACLGTPGFTYLAGCITSGFPPPDQRHSTCLKTPCEGVEGPPFSSCRALSIACGELASRLARTLDPILAFTLRLLPSLCLPSCCLPSLCLPSRGLPSLRLPSRCFPSQ